MNYASSAMSHALSAGRHKRRQWPPGRQPPRQSPVSPGASPERHPHRLRAPAFAPVPPAPSHPSLSHSPRLTRSAGAAKPAVGAIYFGDWAPDPWMELMHGKGWTEWALPMNAQPRYPGHAQPNLPIDAPGWGPSHPESDPGNMAVKIDAAADHGVDFFMFDWLIPWGTHSLCNLKSFNLALVLGLFLTYSLPGVGTGTQRPATNLRLPCLCRCNARASQRRRRAGHSSRRPSTPLSRRRTRSGSSSACTFVTRIGYVSTLTFLSLVSSNESFHP